MREAYQSDRRDPRFASVCATKRSTALNRRPLRLFLALLRFLEKPISLRRVASFAPALRHDFRGGVLSLDRKPKRVPVLDVFFEARLDLAAGIERGRPVLAHQSEIIARHFFEGSRVFTMLPEGLVIDRA